MKRSIDPVPFSGDIIYSPSGSVTSGDQVKGSMGSFELCIRQFVQEYERYQPMAARQGALLIMDSAPPHRDHASMVLLRQHNIDVMTIPPNTSSTLQPSDAPLLHGQLQVNKRKMLAKALKDGQPLNLAEDPDQIKSLVAQTFTREAITTTLKSMGLEYRPNTNYRQGRVTDESALAFVQAMAQKGTFDPRVKHNDSSMRSKSVLALNTLLRENVLPAGTRSLVSPESIVAMSTPRIDLTRARSVCVGTPSGKRDRRCGVGSIVLDKPLIEGTYIVNFQHVLDCRQEALNAKALETKEKKAASAERTAKRDMKAATTLNCKNRLALVVEAFPGKDLAWIEPMERNICRYISGKNQKNDLLWAIERVHKLSEKKGEILVRDPSILKNASAARLIASASPSTLDEPVHSDDEWNSIDKENAGKMELETSNVPERSSKRGRVRATKMR